MIIICRELASHVPWFKMFHVKQWFKMFHVKQFFVLSTIKLELVRKN